MAENLLQIPFDNKLNPNSTFDLVHLEELLHRDLLRHSIEEQHRVEFFILLLITEGRGTHSIDFTNYRYSTGTLFTIRKDQIHQFLKTPDTKGFLLLFTDEFLVSYLEKLEAEKSLQLFNELLGVPKIQLKKNEYITTINIINRIKKEYLEKFDEYSLGIIRSELHILITTLFRIKSQSNPTVFSKKYLEQFISFQQLVEAKANQTVRVADYASMLAISTKTLNTISQSIVNKSAKAFIDEICTKQIKRLLINTSLSIKEIAHASGFEETTNFFKFFKRQTGFTPEKFRASY